MKRLLVPIALVAAAVIQPMAANAATGSTGVVVARSGHLIAIASPSGTVQTVRSQSRARVGARVRVTGSAVRVLGRARSAHIRGVVVRRSSGRLVVAAGNSLITMRLGSRRFSSLSDNGTSTPPVGTTVDTTTSVSSGQLDLTSLQTGGTVGSIQIQATVQAVAPGVIVLTINGQPMAFGLPAGITLPASLVGQTITLSLNLTSVNPVATPRGHEDEDDNEDEGEDDDD